MAKKSFESALSRLEQVTTELESGELSLEKSLARFSEGIELARYCNAVLDEARGKIELLSKGQDGGFEALPLADDEENDEDADADE